MKIKVEWEMETRGESEIEVDTAEVLAWLNDPLTGGPEAGTVTEVTAQDCLDWLECGDDEAWIDQVDIERDAKDFPWNPVELKRLVTE